MLAASHHHSHRAFDQAARLEHARERQLIEQQHREAEEAAAAMRALVAAMQPQTDWPAPPEALQLDASWQVGADSGALCLSLRNCHAWTCAC